MSRADKAAAIAEISEKLRSSNAAVLTEYRGLTVQQITELRTTLRGHATYAVVKNTLTELAAKDAGVTAFDGQLVGPSAIAFVDGDPVEAAKGLRDFAKANPLLVIKSGVLDGAPLSAAEIGKLADLESREVLLAKLAGVMNASLSAAVSLFAAPLSQAARTVDALRAKVEQDGPSADAVATVTVTATATATTEDEDTDDVTTSDAASAPTSGAADSSTDVAEGGDAG
ncbi:MAG: 50S ribosomal protein L10 [Dermatophilaceae bacterium]